ncbi:MAG: hypothetical protein JST31_07710 [Actinobacteria bacterium]|nr:hypothetical protein [Actinomycetota bacterium]
MRRALAILVAACFALASQASASASGSGTRTTRLGELTMTTPRYLVAGRTRFEVQAEFGHVGWLTVTLVHGGARVSRGVLIATEPRTVALALKVPRRLEPGVYRLRAFYRPLGERPLTRQLRLAVRGPRGRSG